MELTEEVRAAFASGREEAVEVNQRGLIEKILARYSGEYTVFRELLQNADDAQASVRYFLPCQSGKEPKTLIVELRC
jgi:hypothetical protein